MIDQIKTTNAGKREGRHMLQRVYDWWLERQIESLGKRYAKAIKSHQIEKAKALGERFKAAIDKRSPSQIQRMHRRMGVDHG